MLIAMDSATAKRLEAVAPARLHKRSAFIREAINKALDALVEAQIAAAYRRQPQTDSEFHFDPESWLPFEEEKQRAPRRRKSRPRRKSKRAHH